MTITSEKILKSIKEAHISPEPRWKFSARNAAFWTLFGAALLVGALSLSVIIDLLAGHDWDIYGYLHKSFPEYLVLSLPYLWIMCAAVFSYLAYYYFVHTRGWYRHRSCRVAAASVFLSAALGVGFFFLGLGNRIERTMAGRIPYYEVMNADKKKIWSRPGEGLLGGEVVKVSGAGAFTVKDYDGCEWEIEKTVSEAKDEAVVVGEEVKIIGEEKKSKTFRAREIRRWEKRAESAQPAIKKENDTGEEDDDDDGKEDSDEKEDDEEREN